MDKPVANMEEAFSREFDPAPEMFVCMDPTGCYHVSWNEQQHEEKMAQVGAEHEARYVSAAPQPSLEGEVGDMVSWLDGQAHDDRNNGLPVTAAKFDRAAALLQSLSADNARLREERETHLRQLSVNLGGLSRYLNEQGDYRDIEDWSAFLLKRVEELRLSDHDHRRRAETAEARLSEAVEVLEPFADVADALPEEQFANSYTPSGKDVLPSMRSFRAARQFLDTQGGGNG